MSYVPVEDTPIVPTKTEKDMRMVKSGIAILFLLCIMNATIGLAAWWQAGGFVTSSKVSFSTSSGSCGPIGCSDNLQNIECGPNATESVGSIKAAITGPGNFTVLFAFSYARPTVPQAILVTSGDPLVTDIWVSGIDAHGFAVNGHLGLVIPCCFKRATLFFYQVI